MGEAVTYHHFRFRDITLAEIEYLRSVRRGDVTERNETLIDDGLVELSGHKLLLTSAGNAVLGHTYEVVELKKCIAQMAETEVKLRAENDELMKQCGLIPHSTREDLISELKDIQDAVATAMDLIA